MFMSLVSDPILWICLFLGYVVGSTPTGLIAGKLKGIDIRKHGSGNIGATNVVRTLGKRTGILVLLCDILKGMIPVFMAQSLAPDNTKIHIAAAVATILGHNYTFWLKFKGGKGIATTAGAMLPLVPVALLFAVTGWIFFFKVTRYVSAGSLVAAAVIPVVEFSRACLTGHWDWPLLIFSLIISLLAIWKHRGNIQRLINGTESRFDKKKNQET